MTTWNDMKHNLNSINPDEMTAIESLAYLHAMRIKKGISQVELAKRIGMKQPQLAKRKYDINSLFKYLESLC